MDSGSKNEGEGEKKILIFEYDSASVASRICTPIDAKGETGESVIVFRLDSSNVTRSQTKIPLKSRISNEAVVQSKDASELDIFVPETPLQSQVEDVIDMDDISAQLLTLTVTSD